MTYVKVFEEKSHGPYEYEIDRTRIIHSCREHWIKGHQRIPARCGISGTLEFQNSRGITAREMTSLESTLEGTVGVKALAALKASVTEKLGTEVVISEQATEKLSLSCPAAKCGSAIYHLYILVRDHKFDVYRSRLFRQPTVTPETLREFVGEYDILIESEPDDPNCPCAPQISRAGGGLVRLFAKRLRITIEYDRLSDGTAQIELGGIPHILDGGLLNISVSSLPQGWAELAGLPFDQEDLALPIEFISDLGDEFLMLNPTSTPEDGSGSSTPTQSTY